MAWGSMRNRAVETAMKHMLANDPRVTQDTDLATIRWMIDEELAKGQKDNYTPLLDFNWNGTERFNDEGYDSFEQKRALAFVLERSDNLVQEVGDTESTSYTRAAANIAELIQRYVLIHKNWNRIAQDNPDKYKKYGNELQRFLGSHQQVLESFLMKIIEQRNELDSAVVARREALDHAENAA